ATTARRPSRRATGPETRPTPPPASPRFASRTRRFASSPVASRRRSRPSPDGSALVRSSLLDVSPDVEVRISLLELGRPAAPPTARQLARAVLGRELGL